MSLFLKPWLEKLISLNIKQKYVHCQILEIKKQSKDNIETIISDSDYTIVANLNKKCILQFNSEYSIPFNEIKGCFIILDCYELHFNEKNKPFILINEFTYQGNECACINTPKDYTYLYSIAEDKFMFQTDYIAKLVNLIELQSKEVKDLIYSNNLHLKECKEMYEESTDDSRFYKSFNTEDDICMFSSYSLKDDKLSYNSMKEEAAYID